MSAEQQISPGEQVTSPANNPPSRRLSGFASQEYWTPERKQAQKELAKKMHDEGRFGGRQPGAGRPRKKTIAETVVEKAEPEVIARELNAMVKHKAPSVKLGAIDRIKAFEDSYQKNMRDDEKEILKLSGKALDQAFAETLAELGIDYDYELSASDVTEEPDDDED